MNEKPEIVIVEMEEEEKPEKGFSSTGISFVVGFFAAMSPFLIRFFLDDGRKERALDMLSFELIFAMVLLSLVVIGLLAMSVRQRRRERVYLRAWQKRRERRIAEAKRLERRREQSTSHRFGKESRHRDSGTTTQDSDEASPETRLLRSLGMEPAP